jgi:LPXTG-motif cell wall-anchored protein
MASSSDDASAPDAVDASGRRDFMRKAAVVGSGAFVVPTIITVDPADAQALTSPPPEPPGQHDSPPAEASDSPGTVAQPAATRPNPANRTRTTTRTELPRTGANLDHLAAAGLAATAGGAALVLWSAESRASARSAEKPSET